MTDGLAELLGSEALLTEAGAVDAGTARTAGPDLALWERWAIEQVWVAEQEDDDD